MEEINGLRLTFNILLGKVAPEVAQAQMEHIQIMIDDFLKSKNITCTGGTGEFLFDEEYYSERNN